MLNLASLLTTSARKDPDKVALTLGPLETTYGQLDDLSARAAAMFRDRGIEPGDTVAIQLPNVPEFAIAYYGALRAGAVVLPLNPLLKKGEVAYHLKDAGAKLLLATVVFRAESEPGAEDAGVPYIPVPLPVGDTEDPRLVDLIGEHEPLTDVANRSPVDPAVLLYTSGTTGSPKGATLTHDNLLWNSFLASNKIVQLTADDIVVGALPLFHSFGQSCQPERLAARRRDGGTAAALRGRARARPDRAAERDRLHGRADDVLGDAARRVGRLARSRRSCACASPAGRRCRSRCCATSRRSSRRASSRGTA